MVLGTIQGLHPNFLRVNRYIRIYCSIFQVEVLIIQSTVRIICDSNIPYHSQLAIRLQCDELQVYGCRKHLNKVQVPTHNDIPEKCRADELARCGKYWVHFEHLQAHD